MAVDAAATDIHAGAVEAAWTLLSKRLPSSPLLPFAGRAVPQRVLLKAESLMPTGSFKIRGATYCIARMSTAQRAKGIVAYSTGNHAQAVAKAARDADVRATIVMSKDAPAAKVANTQAWGAEVVMADSSSHARRALAEQIALETGAFLIPPYDHADVIAGQGTIGLELLLQLHGDPPAAVYVPVGGGGLLAGIAVAIKARSPHTMVIGVEPELEDDARRSFAAGALMTAAGPSASMADAIKVQRMGASNFELIRRHVDAMVTVSESDIGRAVLDCFEANRLLAEPAGAVALAAARTHRSQTDHPELAGRPVVAIVSGGNTTIDFIQTLQGASS